MHVKMRVGPYFRAIHGFSKVVYPALYAIGHYRRSTLTTRLIMRLYTTVSVVYTAVLLIRRILYFLNFQLGCKTIVRAEP